MTTVTKFQDKQVVRVENSEYMTQRVRWLWVKLPKIARLFITTEDSMKPMADSAKFCYKPNLGYPSGQVIKIWRRWKMRSGVKWAKSCFLKMPSTPYQARGLSLKNS